MPRPAALVALSLLMVPGTADASWRSPVTGDVVADFAYSARAPFRAGQRRGVDLAARPGGVVVSACAGRVTHAGAVPRRRLGVSVRCGRLVATHLGLGRLLVRRGARVVAGGSIGTAGRAGVIRLGARRAGRPFGYVDPLTLIGAQPRPLGPAPTSRPPRPPGAARPRPRPLAAPEPASAPARVPVAAWAGLALLAFSLPVGGLVRRRRRARGRLVPHPR